jgi:hypothetical protein
MPDNYNADTPSNEFLPDTMLAVANNISVKEYLKKIKNSKSSAAKKISGNISPKEYLKKVTAATKDKSDLFKEIFSKRASKIKKIEKLKQMKELKKLKSHKFLSIGTKMIIKLGMFGSSTIMALNIKEASGDFDSLYDKIINFILGQSVDAVRFIPSINGGVKAETEDGIYPCLPHPANPKDIDKMVAVFYVTAKKDEDILIKTKGNIDILDIIFSLYKEGYKNLTALTNIENIPIIKKENLANYYLQQRDRIHLTPPSVDKIMNKLEDNLIILVDLENWEYKLARIKDVLDISNFQNIPLGTKIIDA